MAPKEYAGKRLGPMKFPIRVRVNPKDPKHLDVVDGVNGNTNSFWITKDGGERQGHSR